MELGAGCAGCRMRVEPGNSSGPVGAGGGLIPSTNVGYAPSAGDASGLRLFFPKK